MARTPLKVFSVQLSNQLSKQVLCWVFTAEYAAVDAGGMMSGHWFPPHFPCLTAHLFYAVGAQHGGIAGLGVVPFYVLLCYYVSFYLFF